MDGNFFHSLLRTLGIEQGQGLMQQGNNIPSGNPLDPGLGGGNMGGIVATPEQIAQSAAVAQQLGIPMDTPAPEAPPQEITVNGAPAPQGPVAGPAPTDASRYRLDAPVSLNNTAWAQEAQAAREANDKGVEHKGYFGIKGTLRDVLGGLGDAFLVGTGKNAIYGPARQQEMVGDAMAGYTQAPRAAVERMTAVSPELSQSMFKDVATAEAQQAAAQVAAQKEAAVRYAQGMKLFGGAMGAANPETYDRMKPILQKIAQNYGLGEEFKIPDTYDPEYASAVSEGTIERYRQLSLEQGDQRIAQGDQRIGISQGQLGVAQQRAAEQARANRAREEISRSRGGSQARNPTDASLAAPLLEKVRSGKGLTPAEDETLTRLGYPATRGQSRGTSGNGRRSVTPPSRFRPVK